MATLATVNYMRRVTHTPNMTRGVYTIPSVLPSSDSPRYELPINNAVGVVRQIKFVMANNAMVDFYLGSSDIDFKGTIYQVVSFHSVIQSCPERNNLNAIFENVDTPSDPNNETVASLYIEITNNSSGTATGEITLELILDEGWTR